VASLRGLRSNGEGEFGERRQELSFRVGIDAEFVVAAAEVLEERVAGADHAGGAQPFESAHRPHSGLEPSMIGFEGIVRVLRHDMARRVAAHRALAGRPVPDL